VVAGSEGQAVDPAARKIAAPLERHSARQPSTRCAGHKAIAWVHPREGGDDYMLDIYFKGKPGATSMGLNHLCRATRRSAKHRRYPKRRHPRGPLRTGFRTRFFRASCL
jgi:hypothetical protein